MMVEMIFTSNIHLGGCYVVIMYPTSGLIGIFQ